MSTLLDMDVEEEHTENEDKDLSYEAYRAYIKSKKSQIRERPVETDAPTTISSSLTTTSSTNFGAPVINIYYGTK